MRLVGYRKLIVVLANSALLAGFAVVAVFVLEAAHVSVAIGALGAGLAAISGLYFQKNVDAKKERSDD
jgi:uncharacterized integral membrane protein